MSLFDESTLGTEVMGAKGPAIRNEHPVLVAPDGFRFTASDGATLGKSKAATIPLAYNTVSRLHARFERRGSEWWLRDLGSRNGTFIEGIRIQCAQLALGAHVRFGAVDFQVQEAALTDTPLWHAAEYGPMVGASVAMRILFAQMDRVAASNASVLLQAETGSGKELAARALHDASPRKDRPFVVVDCTSIPEGLVETELFGAVKGAYTGAIDRMGAFEAANGGTVFLDEIGELPIAVQPKLLRVLENRTIRRVGHNLPRPVDVRLLAATHRDLAQMAGTHAFREDLYFRLAVVTLSIPPLRERPRDIVPLARRFAEEFGFETPPGFAQKLLARQWPGNVRELRNVVQHAALLGPDLALDGPTPFAKSNVPGVDLERPFKELKTEWVDYLEKEYARGWLARCDGNVSAAAEGAGVDRTYLHRLIKKHGLSRG